MIFVTVGHQMPFDRLIRAVDEWAMRGNCNDVFAQIGDASYVPKHIQFAPFLKPEEFDQRMHDASAVIAHAGTGTIIAALQLGKPLLVLPRLSKFGETRNDHQVSTARHFGDAGRILVAQDESELAVKIENISQFRPKSAINGQAAPELLARLRSFAFHNQTRRI